MNKENMAVLTNIIGAVESGGQVYGQRRYAAYAGPYANSSIEYTVTLGWAQNYGSEAQKLISMILEKDKAAFRKIDTAGIEKMLTHNWVKEKWSPTAAQKKVLIALIDSPAGHTCQDELFAELMEKYIKDCENTYTKEVHAVMMYCEIRHLGGKGAADRIFKRCSGTYSLDSIMASLKKDQDDKSSSNQVGDAKFWTRHRKCREFIGKYAVDEAAAAAAAEENIVKNTAEVSAEKEETMAKTAAALVAQARTWIGCKESNGSHKKIIDVYNAHKPLARNYKVSYRDAWCATFVSACAIKTGMTDIIPTECGCGAMVNLFKKLGEWDENDARVPRSGDIIFYDWDDSGSGDNKGNPDHVGIVEKVSGNTITVIEGNKNDAVGRRTLKVNGRYIRGYGVPKYSSAGTSYFAPATASSTSSGTSSTNLKKGNTGSAVKTMQTMLIACGYSCGSAGVDGSFGNDTYKALTAFQKANGLTVDGIYGPKSRAALEKAYAARGKKSVEALAKEVIAGKWGKGSERKRKLTNAGYDYDAVQKKVNELLK